MTDLEIYTRWLRIYENLDTKHLRGEITADQFDRCVGFAEERLGVNTWTVERWAAAVEEGA